MSRLLSILILVCCFAVPDSWAQSSNRNYIAKSTMLDEQGQNSVVLVEYYDGLGRKEQTATNGVKPGNASLAALSRTSYDGCGRVGQNFLPVSANGLDYQPEIVYKNDDSKALSVISYDALGRPLSATTPGCDMGGRGKKYSHWANTANSVKKYVTTDDGVLEQGGYYKEGTLIWERITDEDNHITDVYTDFLGQKVLERHIQERGNADTYFVYNDCGKLCYVLQPMYQTEESLEKYAFQYRYNERGLMSEKTIPGCEKTIYTYDDANRLLTMQDGEMRKKGLTRHYAYDGLGRVKKQTLCQGETTCSKEQTNFYDGDYSFIDNDSCSLTEAAKTWLAYSGEMGVTSARRKELGNTFVCGNIQTASDGSEIVTAVYYDRKGRVVEKNSKLLDAHSRREQFSYTFTGKALTHTVVDYKGAEEIFRSVTSNNYDATTGLLVSTDVTTSVGGGNVVKKQIASFEYDDYGRISSTTHGSAKQTTNYDVRDWPTELASTNFTEHLQYTDRYYNGNVSNIRYAGPYSDYTYRFSYDKLDRLIGAEYTNNFESDFSWTEPDFSEFANYDANGNITRFQRIGFPDESSPCVLLDDLEMSYNGNQLSEVVDNENDITYMTTTNFIQNGKESAKYTYNANGALEMDENSGIAFVEYDDFGYTKSVYFQNGSIINFVHTPDGEKLRATYTTSVSHITKPVGLPFSLAPPEVQSVIIKDYWGNDIICKNGAPEQFFFDGGFAAIKGEDLTWHYYVKDHLGSNRIVQDELGKVEATYHFYPFGGQFEHSEELFTHNISQPFTFSGRERIVIYGLDQYDFGARLYAPLLGRWHSVDPLSEKYYSWSPYVFCLNNPLRHKDTDGRVVETLWDVANVVMDAASLVNNVAIGNYVSAVVDGGALLADAAATALPGVPGGAGTALKTYRAAKTVHSAQAGNRVLRATKYNYRKALQQVTGKSGKGYEAHHTLPQKYRAQFEKLGINIDEPGNVVWRKTNEHRKKSRALTKEWDKFMIRKKPPTKKLVIQFRNEMEKKHFGTI